MAHYSESSPLISNNYNTNATPPASTDAFANDFEECWTHYPRKLDKGAARKNYISWRKRGATSEDLLSATRHYAFKRDREISRGKSSPDYTLHGGTFYGPGERWQPYVDGDPDAPGPGKPPSEMSDAEILALTANRSSGPAHDYEVV